MSHNTEFTWHQGLDVLAHGTPRNLSATQFILSLDENANILMMMITAGAVPIHPMIAVWYLMKEHGWQAAPAVHVATLMTTLNNLRRSTTKPETAVEELQDLWDLLVSKKTSIHGSDTDDD